MYLSGSSISMVSHWQMWGSVWWCRSPDGLSNVEEAYKMQGYSEKSFDSYFLFSKAVKCLWIFSSRNLKLSKVSLSLPLLYLFIMNVSRTFLMVIGGWFNHLYLCYLMVWFLMTGSVSWPSLNKLCCQMQSQTHTVCFTVGKPCVRTLLD